jgi:Nif-specific regulatory protein
VTDSGTNARFHLLYELGCAFAARLELAELLPMVAAETRRVLDASGVSVLLHDAARKELYFPYVAQDDAQAAQRLLALRMPSDRGIAGTVVQTGKAERIDDVAADPRFYPEVDRETGVATRTMLCAPLRARSGVLGVISVVNRRDGLFTDDDLRLLEALAGSIAVAVENAMLFETVKASEERLRAQVGALRRDLARLDRFTEIVSISPAMRDVFRLMESAAASPITVLIEGETGTGKELVARGIHRTSTRADGPFIAINCAAMAENLLESELFGHRKGAFTGALQDRRGLFEAANGGTIFLDEVGEMPAAMQAKLLRVLQEGEVTPVGDERPRRVDVRVIAATNRDLAAEVKGGRFRQDLFYRIGAFPVRLPPLQERREDVPVLAERFLAAAAARHGKRVAGIDPAVLDRLAAYAWPGNVRELQNEIERAVALCPDGERIGLELTSPKLAGTPVGPDPAASAVGALAPTEPLRDARERFEIQYLRSVLRAQEGNVSRAARVLGLSRVMLQKKMKVYGLRS